MNNPIVFCLLSSLIVYHTSDAGGDAGLAARSVQQASSSLPQSKPVDGTEQNSVQTSSPMDIEASFQSTADFSQPVDMLKTDMPVMSTELIDDVTVYHTISSEYFEPHTVWASSGLDNSSLGNTMSISVLPFTTSTPPATDTCDDVLCKREEGLIINASKCDSEDKFEINATAFSWSSELVRVEIWTNLSETREEIICKWTIPVPKQHHVVITFDKLEEGGGYLDIRMKNGTDANPVRVTMPLLRKGNVSVYSRRDVQFSFFSNESHSISFHYTIAPNILPNQRLSDTAGYVTSPGFGVLESYPPDYDGTFDIHVPANHSVLFSFTQFHLEDKSNFVCAYDKVIVYEVECQTNTTNKSWTGCGQDAIGTQLYRTCLRLQFSSDSSVQKSGFKMVYTVLPTNQEPGLTADGKYNCSVPYFEQFKPVFYCNSLQECQGNEDEEDCLDQTTDFYISSTTKVETCRELLCETEPGFFVLQTSQCQPYGQIKLNPSTELQTLEVVIDPMDQNDYIICKWSINACEKCSLFMQFDQLMVDANDLKIFVSNYTIAEYLITGQRLQEGSVNLTAAQVLEFDYRSSEPHTVSALTFHFMSVPNVLPSGSLSQTAGFVTSPNFGSGQFYPQHFDAVYDINVPDNSLVAVNVAYLSIWSYAGNRCGEDFVAIYEMYQNNTVKSASSVMCGYHITIPMMIFNTSIRVRFRSADHPYWSGFKIIYAIIPTKYMHVLLTDKPYNCSVPYFDLFKPLIGCNLLTECEGNEDETGCDYSGEDCGPGALAAGTKCYTLMKPSRGFSWYDASNECKNKQQELISLKSITVINRLKKLTFEYHIFDLYIGLQLTEWSNAAATTSTLYRTIWRWNDGSSALTVNVTRVYNQKYSIPACVWYNEGQSELSGSQCFVKKTVDILCEFDRPFKNSSRSHASYNLSTEDIGRRSLSGFGNRSMISCPQGYVTRDFLACDVESHCGAGLLQLCRPGPFKVPLYDCDNGKQQIPYSLVCDHINHCADQSDENFCYSELCAKEYFRCDNNQCIRSTYVCNGVMNCFDKSDEICQLETAIVLSTEPPPVIVNINGDGTYTFVPSSICPSTHFRCMDGYCLPVYLRCNGIADCTGQEDEIDCTNYMCPNFYRCRSSQICLHPDYVCDGVFQCPSFDDELLCEELICPKVCHCQGLSFVCNASFPVSSFGTLRYLDVSNTPLPPDFIRQNRQLIGVRLSNTRMIRIPKLILPNLRSLDLSNNKIISINIQAFSSLTNLRFLNLRGNPLQTITNIAVETSDMPPLPEMMLSKTEVTDDRSVAMYEMDLSFTQLEHYNGSALSKYSLLKSLNFSHSKLNSITVDGFQSTPKLEIIDMRGTSVKVFPNDLLKNLTSLKTVYADQFVFCCKAMLPDGFDIANCHAEQDLLTSCEDLLRSNVYRVSLWIFASLSVFGNIGSFVSRMYLSKEDKKFSSFSVFVTNLSLADFLMGVYLTIIGAADQSYRGDYLWHSEQWRNSAICSLAGFLSLMSSEVSAFIICLITLDRFLVLAFPFSKNHFKKRSTMGACAVAWVLGVILAGIPLLPLTSHWEFYSQTGICIPLPFSNKDTFMGQKYSQAVIIGINLVIFILIAVGQFFIYRVVRRNTMASSRGSTSKHAAVARRLTSIVVSDFLCWFPIGILGMLAAAGVPIPMEVNISVVIFVLPFNSAVNPFLYTFNTIMEKRRQSREAQLLQRLEKMQKSLDSRSHVKSSVIVKRDGDQGVQDTSLNTSVSDSKKG